MTRLPDDTPRNLARLAACFAACLLVFALCAGCELPSPGESGEVCTEPDAADCPSNAGGEPAP